MRALSLEFFQSVVNCKEVCVRVVAEYFVKVLIPAMVEISVAGRAKQATMDEQSFESVADEVNVMQLE